MASRHMRVLLLNDTRVDPNPGCQATVTNLVHLLSSRLRAEVSTRPRGDGYEYFSELTNGGCSHSPERWRRAVERLEHESSLTEQVSGADLIVANLEGTFHHHTIGALALGGALAVAHRMGKRTWAVNGTVEGIDPWLLREALAPADLISLREPRSVLCLHKHSINAIQSADAVFLDETLVDRHVMIQSAPRSVLYTPGVLAGTATSLQGAIAGVLADLGVLFTLGWQPTFLQVEEREATIARAVEGAGWLVADAGNLAWREIGRYLRQFALVVSGRYHVLIFAAMAGVPAIALPSNTFKMEGLLDLLERPLAFAPDALGLRLLLERDGPPASVDEDRIRWCRSLAQRNVPPHFSRNATSEGDPEPGEASSRVTPHRIRTPAGGRTGVATGEALPSALDEFPSEFDVPQRVLPWPAPRRGPLLDESANEPNIRQRHSERPAARRASQL